MKSLNRVELLGHLGAAPEIRSFHNGGRVAQLSVATSESWKDRQTGERAERTEWHTVVISNDGLVKVAEKYLKKGSRVYVEGQQRTRKWQDRDGRDRWSTEVVVPPYNGRLIMLDRAEGGQGGQSGQSAAGGRSHHDEMDDDVPF